MNERDAMNPDTAADTILGLPPRDVDPKDWTADQTLAFIRLVMREGDMKAVVAAMHILAVKDPHSAQLLLDAVEIGSVLRATPDAPPS